MIRTLLSILLLFISYPVVAQHMDVKDFRLLDRDLTANSEGTKRISPQDGNVSALIKVVTTESGFNFDGGSYALVGNPEYKSGEIWIYVPARAQKLTISHSKFGILRDFYYPIPIEAGRTYEMLLDPGAGKFITIQTSIPRSTIFLDGDKLGESPIYNQYVLYGKHKLSAINDKMEGELNIDILKDGNSSFENVTIPMTNQSLHFGQVIIKTDKDAEIIFNGDVKGIGTWYTDLREGNYVVETHKVNCDNSKTSFVVKPQITNIIDAAVPVQHKGHLSLYIRPRGTEISLDGKWIPVQQNMELPVGTHTISFAHKDYYSFEKEYDIQHNRTISDTINLRRIQYLKDKSFYFGTSYTIGQFSGIVGHVGVIYSNIDIQLSYMFGLSKSRIVNFYDQNDYTFLSKNEYTMNSFDVKIGYQFALATRFGIVPQIGYSLHQLKGKAIEGSNIPGNGAMSNCLSIGGKFIYSPIHHFCLFVAPEYDISIKKDNKFGIVSDVANFNANSFFCNLGIIANF